MIDHVTNEEFVADLMRFSEHGALAQLFVIDAIGKAADAVVAAGRDEIREKMKGNIIHPDAWYNVALEIKTRMDKNYGA